MLLTIQNAQLQVTVDSLGAQLYSIRDSHDRQYLWQGDPAYWRDRAPVLFPIIGRLEGKQYQIDGKVYHMDIHGFAVQSEFAVKAKTGDALVLSMQSTPETLACYPAEFTLEITYRLDGNTLAVENRVTNCGEAVMHFGLGGHPGFCVPLEKGRRFEEYRLEFDRVCSPERIGFTDDTILVNGLTKTYPLENGTTLALCHDLFDQDAIILQNIARKVCLTSGRSGPSITVSYPDMPYLGIWHWPQTDAPYVCIEPWTSLPGRSGVVEDIATREDFVHVEVGCVYTNTWTIQVSEGKDHD